jgi:hypothetical protein
MHQSKSNVSAPHQAGPCSEQRRENIQANSSVRSRRGHSVRKDKSCPVKIQGSAAKARVSMARRVPTAGKSRRTRGCGQRTNEAGQPQAFDWPRNDFLGGRSVGRGRDTIAEGRLHEKRSKTLVLLAQFAGGKIKRCPGRRSSGSLPMTALLSSKISRQRGPAPR